MSLWIPNDCIRGFKTCKALALIESDDGKSFICSGLNDGTDREMPQDRFTLCFKNAAADDRAHMDDQDMKDMISVLAQALSADQHIKQDTD